MPVESNRLLKKVHGKNFQSLWEVLTPVGMRHALRVEIHLDPSYWHQSHARLKRYNGEKWNLIAYLHYTEISESFSGIPGNIHSWAQGYKEKFNPEPGFLKLEKALLDEFRLIEGF